jgi:predicted small metal-binding protein
MLSVTCRDVGVDCDYKGTGETEEELMNNLVEHGIKELCHLAGDLLSLLQMQLNLK